MARTITKTFTLTDGAMGLRLAWKSGKALPDFREEPVIVARTTTDGFEWATADTKCPHCNSSFPIASKLRSCGENDSSDIGLMLLTPEAIPLLLMIGNVSIDTSAPMRATCPHCGTAFAISLEARESELAIHVDDRWIALKCPGGETVYFLSDGAVLASKKQLKGTPAAEAFEFLALPQLLGKSKEAKDWLCWALGIKAGSSSFDDCSIDALDLALRWRFKGYDEAFLAEARAYIAQAGVRSDVLNGLFTLPRNFTDQQALIALLEKSGLPNKPSVRKAAAARPAALAIISKTSIGKLCGKDPNLAVRLLRSEKFGVEWIGALLDRKGNLSRLISLAASEEKPSYLVQRLLDIDAKTLAQGVLGFDGLKLDSFDGLKAYRLARKNYSLSEIIRKPALLDAYARSNKSISITYGSNSSLQGEHGGYKFFLPRSTGQFESAGATLKNCLGDGYGKNAALGNTLIFLVSKDESLVAAVEVSPEKKTVVQMFAKANRKITPTEDLGLAISLWAHDKHIRVRGCDFA